MTEISPKPQIEIADTGRVNSAVVRRYIEQRVGEPLDTEHDYDVDGRALEHDSLDVPTAVERLTPARP